MSANTVVLITGSNRGIGLEFVRTYLARQNHTVVAAVRDPAKSAAVFDSIERPSSSNLIVVRIDSKDGASTKTAIQQIQDQNSIDHLDVVIANAGIEQAEARGPVDNLNPDTCSEHFEVNTVAPLRLYQATHPLLAKSNAKNGPQFVPISSLIGSIGGAPGPTFLNPYGASKAALNIIFRRAHTEILHANGELEPKAVDWSHAGYKGVAPYTVNKELGARKEGKKDRLAIILFHPG